jgi:hypothetical protein
VRFRQVEADLENIDRSDRRALWGIGWSFFAIGLTKKVLLADTPAAVIDPALGNAASLGTASAWMCMVGYAYQLYFDFSGYSDMAVGLGYLFGIRIPQNFDSPYKALSPSDFWSRWHISLSSCMRDYVYVPLGGNRKGAAHTYRNLMLTMLIGGLWHGAGWSFILWGAYHGLLLVLHRLTPSWDSLPAPLRRVLMFVLVTVGWVFFRSKDLSTAGSVLGKMFTFTWAPWPPGVRGLVLLLLIAGAVAHFGPNTWQINHRGGPRRRWRWESLSPLACSSFTAASPHPFCTFNSDVRCLEYVSAQLGGPDSAGLPGVDAGRRWIVAVHVARCLHHPGLGGDDPKRLHRGGHPPGTIEALRERSVLRRSRRAEQPARAARVPP